MVILANLLYMIDRIVYLAIERKPIEIDFALPNRDNSIPSIRIPNFFIKRT
jgi:hypothetical protein